MGFRDEFDITPQQYHAGLDKLWDAYEAPEGYKVTESDDIFTLIPKQIEALRKERDALTQYNENFAEEVTRLSTESHDYRERIKELEAALREVKKLLESIGGMV
jgi:chromosome segregation ATPase